MFCLLLLLILSAVFVFKNSCLCVCFAGREAEGMDMGQVLYSHGVFLAIIRVGVVTMFAGGGGGGGGYEMSGSLQSWSFPCYGKSEC